MYNLSTHFLVCLLSSSSYVMVGIIKIYRYPVVSVHLKCHIYTWRYQTQLAFGSLFLTLQHKHSICHYVATQLQHMVNRVYKAIMHQRRGSVGGILFPNCFKIIQICSRIFSSNLLFCNDKLLNLL